MARYYTDNKEMEEEKFWRKRTSTFYILSILVFWIHCSSFGNYRSLPFGISLLSRFVQNVLPSAAVPLFFIISGATFYRNYDTGRGKIKRRLFSLGIPYLVWNILNLLLASVFSMFLSQYFVGRQAFEWSAINIFEGIFVYKYNGPFWFICALIVFILLSPVINKIVSHRIVGFCIILGVIILRNIGLRASFLPFSNFICFSYYLLGAYIGKHYFDYFSKKKESLIAVISFCIIFVIWVIRLYVLIRDINIGVSFEIILNMIYALALWNALDIITLNKKIPDFMNHSFFVYAMHINVSAIIAKLFYFCFPSIWPFSILNFVVTTVLTLVIIEIVCKILQKFTPAIYSVLSGGR